MKPSCVECGTEMPGANHGRMYCSSRCKVAWRKKNGPKGPVGHHRCRMCGKKFKIGKGQHNKWLCSAECRRASVSKSMRDFHKRRPEMEAIYRSRTKAKRLPDGNLVRLRRTSPDAPMACESCGETRVLDFAHKPGHERFGRHRSSDTLKWPEQGWVLCPTCHALIDRMHYDPSELGLSLYQTLTPAPVPGIQAGSRPGT